MKRMLTVIIIGLLSLSMFSILAPQAKAEACWTPKAPLPHVQAAFGAAVAKGKMYAIGGQYYDQGQYVWLDTNHEYDPVSDELDLEGDHANKTDNSDRCLS